MREVRDAQGRFSGLEPILLTQEQDAQLRRANPRYRGQRFQPRDGFPVLAFDAGHGVEYPDTGTPDNGATSDNNTPVRTDDISEANITLRMANYAAEHATRNGFDALVTRTTRTFSSAPRVATRADAFDFRIAAANNAAAYVSFHVNHAASEAANGTQVYIQRGAPAHADTERFGRMLAANTRSSIRRPDGIEWDHAYDARFLVNGRVNPDRIKSFAMIRGAHVPSALVETGFLQNGVGSNPGDYDDLRNTTYLQNFSQEIVRDMISYVQVARNPQMREMVRNNPGLCELYRDTIADSDASCNPARENVSARRTTRARQ
jgi:N-acetylmuramoyl-L-alanine amidase